MSFLDNLENDLKALESREEGNFDQDKRREADRARAIAAAPWAERLKREPYAQGLMQKATLAGRERRVKVNLAWIDTTLRLEARDYRLELRPSPNGIVAVFLKVIEEIRREPVNLASDPANLTADWMAILDEQKRLDDLEAAAADEDDALAS
jgi:hypothetical protein